ncbi:protein DETOXIFICATION 44, chloroplastic-like [Apium graveolens]|uniref:protein DETOXIFICATION 44, chloroplastic-like n=1 Tax=Apium graveolens TaxID=4045 RepID=UPI003D7A8E5F
MMWYMIPVILLWKLNDKVSLISPKFESTKFFQYLKSGGSLLLSYTTGYVAPLLLAAFFCWSIAESTVVPQVLSLD